MTQVYDYTQKEEETGKKPIEFVSFLNCKGNKESASRKPRGFDFVARISEADRYNTYDLFVAWDKGSKVVGRYLGHWNDGVINETD